MSVLGALAGGVVGTVVLATSLQLATSMGVSRVDLPFLLGSLVSGHRETAKGVGYALQAAIGLTFALLYAGLFAAVGTSAVWLGALLGLLHGLATVTLLVPGLLPAVHRRLGTSSTAADDAPAVGRPGPLMLAYGATTPAVTVAAHVAYGAVVAVFASAPA